MCVWGRNYSPGRASKCCARSHLIDKEIKKWTSLLVSEPRLAFQFRYPGSGRTCGSAETKTEEPFRSLPYPSCPPLLHPPSPSFPSQHPWPLHWIVALLRLTCNPPLPPWCLHAVIASSRSWRRCFTAIKWVWCTGTWRWVTGITLLPFEDFCYVFVLRGKRWRAWEGGLRVSYLCSLHLCKWNAACYISRENVTQQTLWLLKGLGLSDFIPILLKIQIFSLEPHMMIQTYKNSRRSCEKGLWLPAPLPSQSESGFRFFASLKYHLRPFPVCALPSRLQLGAVTLFSCRLNSSLPPSVESSAMQCSWCVLSDRLDIRCSPRG